MSIVILGICALISGVIDIIHYFSEAEKKVSYLITGILYFVISVLAFASHLRDRDIVIDLRDNEEDDYAD